MAYSNMIYNQQQRTPLVSMSQFYPPAIAQAIEAGFNNPNANIFAYQNENDYSSMGEFQMTGPNGLFERSYNNTQYYGNPFAGGYLSTGYDYGYRNGTSFSSDYRNTGNFVNMPGYQFGSYTNTGHSSFSGHGMNYSNNYNNSGSYMNTPFFSTGYYNNSGDTRFSGYGFNYNNSYNNSGGYLNTPFFNAYGYHNTGNTQFSGCGFNYNNNYDNSDFIFNPTRRLCW